MDRWSGTLPDQLFNVAKHASEQARIPMQQATANRHCQTYNEAEIAPGKRKVVFSDEIKAVADLDPPKL